MRAALYLHVNNYIDELHASRPTAEARCQRLPFYPWNSVHRVTSKKTDDTNSGAAPAPTYPSVYVSGVNEDTCDYTLVRVLPPPPPSTDVHSAAVAEIGARDMMALFRH